VTTRARRADDRRVIERGGRRRRWCRWACRDTRYPRACAAVANVAVRARRYDTVTYIQSLAFGRTVMAMYATTNVGSVIQYGWFPRGGVGVAQLALVRRREMIRDRALTLCIRAVVTGHTRRAAHCAVIERNRRRSCRREPCCRAMAHTAFK